MYSPSFLLVTLYFHEEPLNSYVYLKSKYN